MPFYLKKEALGQATTLEARGIINKKYDYEIELAKQSLFDSVHAQTETLVKEAEKTLIQETKSNKCQILSQLSQTVTFCFVTVVCECLCWLEGVFDDCHNCHTGSKHDNRL